jgi:hypothetical protein
MAIALRSVDYIHLSKVMRPVLQQLFWTGADQDLTLADDALDEAGEEQNNDRPDSEFERQMTDTLCEMANVFIGLYTKAVYKICGLTTQYSLPRFNFDYDQKFMQEIYGSGNASNRHQLVIQNEFFLKSKSIMLWCIISPCRESLEAMLENIESHQDKTE